MQDFMYVWSWLFSPYIGGMLFVVLAVWLAVHWREIEALIVLITGASMGTAIVAIKAIYQRPRPHMDAALWATDGSFPSGHAAGAVCFAVLAWWFLTPKKYLRQAFPLVVIIAALVGGSRLYFGVHFPSDVIFGYLLGVFFAGAAIAIDRQSNMR